MKKLLSILATIALCGTTSINVVACGGGETPDPSTQKINLSGLPDSVKVTTIDSVNSYKTALINVLKKDEFNDLSETDVKITKEYGNPLIDTDITTGDLVTKITAKDSSDKFTSSAIITITIIAVINLSGLPNKVDVTTEFATVNDYKTALIKVLKEKKFNNLLEADVNITKEDGSALGIDLINKNITTGDLITRVTAINPNDPNAKFTGFKIITVALITTEKIDLSGLPDEVNVTTKFPYAFAYERALIKVLKKDEFHNLLETDVNITQEDGKDLPTKITAGVLLTKITIKSDKFTGFKIISVNVAIATEIANLRANVEALAFKNKDELYAGTKDGWIYKIDLSSPVIPTKKEIINLGEPIKSLAFNKNKLYAGTSDQKIYKIDLSSPTKNDFITLKTGVIAESLAFNKQNELYAGTNTNWIYQIVNLTSRAPTAKPIIDLGGTVESLAFNKQNELYVGAKNNIIYQIVNLTSPTPTAKLIIDFKVNVESLAFNNKDQLYAGTSDSKIYKIDQSSSITTVKEIADLGAGMTSSLAFNNKDELYAGTSDHKIYEVKF